MDAVEPELVAQAEHTLTHVPGVIEVSGVRLRWIGHRLRAEVDLVVDPALSVSQGHHIAAEAKHQLLHEMPKINNATVHISPHATPDYDPHELLQHHLH